MARLLLATALLLSSTQLFSKVAAAAPDEEATPLSTPAGTVLPTSDALVVAADADVDPMELQGAVNTLHLQGEQAIREYLYDTGDLARPEPPPAPVLSLGLRAYAYATYPGTAWCIEKIVQVESGGWYTRGWNSIPVGRRAEHASGLGGFLPSTWASTPQAGRSIWDGYAQIDAINWMLKVGRGKEFAAVLWGRCG
jgi:hypothetical protein